MGTFVLFDLVLFCFVSFCFCLFVVLICCVICCVFVVLFYFVFAAGTSGVRGPTRQFRQVVWPLSLRGQQGRAIIGYAGAREGVPCVCPGADSGPCVAVDPRCLRLGGLGGRSLLAPRGPDQWGPLMWDCTQRVWGRAG